MSLRAICTLWLLGCSAWSGFCVEPQSPLIVTASSHEPSKATLFKAPLDRRYPAGTRILLLKPPYAAGQAEVLSKGLSAAGSPVVSYDGQRAVFSAKISAQSEWQIFECRLSGGQPRLVTSVPGGAAHPALLPDGSIVFVSPASGAVQNMLPQLFSQSPAGHPRKLTFAAHGATDPTMLTDGRILFVSPNPSPTSGSSLFTINNDGTELTAFAGQHGTPSLLSNPKQLPDKRVAFLSSTETGAAQAEVVSMARPFASRLSLLAPNLPASLVSPFGQSNLLVCARAGSDPDSASACYLVPLQAPKLGMPLCSVPGFECVEAIEATAPQRPMGKLSNMDGTKHTGQILCLDINDTTLKAENEPAAKAAKVRITMASDPGACGVLGEVPVQEDGSFMAEVPADTLLGFEALDAHGQVLRREAPSIWVRPGENRSCVGCHATHNRAPHNHRPIAVTVPVPKLTEPSANAQSLAHQTH